MKRLYEIIEIGNRDDVLSRCFDYIIVIAILLNLTAMLLSTFDSLSWMYSVLHVIDITTGIIFAVEYILRVLTAKYKYNKGNVLSAVRFMISFTGVVDLCTILPIFVTGVLPGGIVAFRLIRVVRTFRLFQITANNDAINLIATVIKQRANQLLAAGFFFIVLDIFASLMMYYIEHPAQPEVFANAFSGIWWSISTLLTVGYGDIYPITDAGKIVAIFVAILGVCAVAVPTGIISAGFMEQYRTTTKASEDNSELIKKVEVLIKSNKDFERTIKTY